MSNNFEAVEFRVTIRFARGYRYLDRCGEALIRLEDVLHKDWIPTEAAPKGGSIRNDTLGMSAAFNSEAVTVQQSEYLSFDHFLDQTCKVVDVLRSTFDIDRLISPTMAVVFQWGFPEDKLEAAETTLRALGLVQLTPAFHAVVEGQPESMSFAVVNAVGRAWRGIPAEVTRRVEAKVVRQVPKPSLDARLLRRVSNLPDRQREALTGLRKLMKSHPVRNPVAVELDLEAWLGGEIAATEFPLHDYLTESHSWAVGAVDRIHTSQQADRE